MTVCALLSASPVMTSCDKDDKDDDDSKKVVKADFDTADYCQTNKLVFFSDTFSLPAKVWVQKANAADSVASCLREAFFVEEKDMAVVKNALFEQTAKLSKYGNFQDGYYNRDSTQRYGVTSLGDLITASDKNDSLWFYVGHNNGNLKLSSVSFGEKLVKFCPACFSESRFPVTNDGKLGAPMIFSMFEQ